MRVDPGMCMYLLAERISRESGMDIVCDVRELKKYAFAFAAAPEAKRLDCVGTANRLYDFLCGNEPGLIKELDRIELGRFYGRAYTDLCSSGRKVRLYDSPEYTARIPFKDLAECVPEPSQLERLRAYYEALESLYSGNKKLAWDKVDRTPAVSAALKAVQEMCLRHDTPEKACRLFATFLGAQNVYQIYFSKNPVCIKHVNACMDSGASDYPGAGTSAPGRLITCDVSRVSTMSGTIHCVYENGWTLSIRCESYGKYVFMGTILEARVLKKDAPVMLLA